MCTKIKDENFHENICHSMKVSLTSDTKNDDMLQFLSSNGCLQGVKEVKPSSYFMRTD